MDYELISNEVYVTIGYLFIPVPEDAPHEYVDIIPKGDSYEGKTVIVTIDGREATIVLD
ncbi:UNVERIFIED_CONTAM: hypothetical protein Cloal_2216 [Acetivibrio alkalicellulosi]